MGIQIIELSAKVKGERENEERREGRVETIERERRGKRKGCRNRREVETDASLHLVSDNRVSMKDTSCLLSLLLLFVYFLALPMRCLAITLT